MQQVLHSLLMPSLGTSNRADPVIPGSELAQGNLQPAPSLALAAAFIPLPAFCLSNCLCRSCISFPSQSAASLCLSLAHPVVQLHFHVCKAPLSAPKALSSFQASSGCLSSLRAARLHKPPSSKCILRARLDEGHSKKES